MDIAKMRVVETIANYSDVLKGCVLTIGNFDGVHLGHQEILVTARKIAQRRGDVPMVVMTFFPHPAGLLHPEKAPGILTPLPLKKHLLAEQGIDYLIVLRDSREFLNLSPESFVDYFLMENIRPRAVVEGPDFNFGRGRSGSIETLQQLGARKGFEVIVVGAREVDLTPGQSVTVSSSLVRDLLRAGSVQDAAVMLGRCYRVIGRVMPGHGRGVKLGFPTANIKPAQQIVPAEGVYAGFVGIADSRRQVCGSYGKLTAVFSIGRARTFAEGRPLVTEAHILEGVVGDLRGKWLAMDFVRRLREQMKFDSHAELAAQIAKDCKQAKEILAAALKTKNEKD